MLGKHSKMPLLKCLPFCKLHLLYYIVYFENFRTMLGPKAIPVHIFWPTVTPLFLKSKWMTSEASTCHDTEKSPLVNSHWQFAPKNLHIFVFENWIEAFKKCKNSKLQIGMSHHDVTKQFWINNLVAWEIKTYEPNNFLTCVLQYSYLDGMVHFMLINSF